MKEFDFSETFIRKRNRIILSLFLLIIPFGVVFTMFLPDFKIEKSIPAVGIAYFCAGIIFAIQTFLINRMQRKLKVSIDEDKLAKQCGKKMQTLSWEEIERVKIVERKKEHIAQIKLYSENPKKNIYLGGFTEMEVMAELIKNNLSNRTLIEHKIWRVDWTNPFVVMPLSLLPAMVLMCIIASMGTKAMNIFAIVCALSIGTGMLIFRPLTKFDIRNKCFEIIISGILLAFGLYAWIYSFLFGQMA